MHGLNLIHSFFFFTFNTALRMSPHHSSYLSLKHFTNDFYTIRHNWLYQEFRNGCMKIRGRFRNRSVSCSTHLAVLPFAHSIADWECRRAGPWQRTSGQPDKGELISCYENLLLCHQFCFKRTFSLSLCQDHIKGRGLSYKIFETSVM